MFAARSAVRAFVRSARAFSSRAAPAVSRAAWTKAPVAAATVAVTAAAFAAPIALAKEGLPLEGVAGSTRERTFIAIKPDGVQRGIIG
jgi:nucleoside-diphosphate kinase